VFQDGVPADGCATLYHEMKHLSDYDHGTNYTSDCYYEVNGKEVDSGISIAEVGAVRAENTYRATQHLPLRTKFGALPMPPPNAACLPPPSPPPRSGGCSVSAVGCPTRTGSSNGDPHIVTFNGYAYPFQAAGEFVLSRSLDGTFEVQTRTAPVPGRDDLTLNTAVAVKFGVHRLALYGQGKPDGDSHSLRLDGQPVAPKPGQVEALPGGASLSTSQGGTFLQMPAGERITLYTAVMGTFNFINVNVTIPPARFGKYVGILGDGGGSRRSDLRTRDGKSVALANAYGNVAQALGITSALPQADAAFHIFVDRTFADSWRISQAESLFTYARGTSTQTFTDRSYPRTDFTAAAGSLQGAAQNCRSAGVAESFLAGCVVDVTATKNTVFARAIAGAQSLVNVQLGNPVDQLRALAPSLPAVNIPNIPSIRIPHF
jgi:hypothetical protein